MKPLGHQRLIANAGSGKTYALVSRFFALLDHQVPPERIIALTFTRKAAGEFLERIFARQLEDNSPAGLARLRVLVDALPRLALGTLDGFFGRIVRAFPFECGLAGELTILDDHAMAMARRTVLDAMFRRQGADEDAFSDFLDLVRQQSRNSESRTVTTALADEIEALHERYLLTPTDRPWGEGLWPGGTPFPGAGEPAALVDAIASLADPGEDPRQQEEWARVFAEIRALRPGTRVSKRTLDFARRALNPPAGKSGGFTLRVFSKKDVVFPLDARPAAVALGRAILNFEIAGHAARSRALYDLVRRFEDPYHALVRGQGLLTFSDVTGLLASAGGATWGGRTVVPFDRQEMDFRLDATYDHWLLDEFQDTSRLQWLAVRNLIDEVVQSDTGRRSFFYVGDTKQAIYTWRGGDPRLFDEIADHYNSGGAPRIDVSGSLSTSRRSAPQILEAVNRLFAPENLAGQAEIFRFPAETLRRWTSAWKTHLAHKTEAGCFSWQQVEDADDRDRAAAELLTELAPSTRGLSCAVLVRSNERGRAVVDALRAAGLEARSEGRFAPCTDNALGATLLSFLRTVAHPGDLFGLRHVEMSALRHLIDGPDFRLRALRDLRLLGFAGAVEKWTDGLTLPAFGADRRRDFLQAAAAFDARRGAAGTIDEFLTFAESYTRSDDPADSAIRVLTIHAAKGLDFDLVVLPDLEGTKLATRRREAAVHLQTSPGGEVAWGLELPPQDVCDTDPVLAGAAADVLAEDTYENLCLYYVAMTRAKSGLYLITTRQGAKTTSSDFNRLLGLTFAPAETPFILGDPTWIDRVAPPAEKPPPSDPDPLPGGPSPLRPEAPSRSGAFHPLGPTAARRTGSALHAFLAQISWSDEGWPDRDALPEDLRTVVETFLASPAAAEVFTRPAEPCDLWREQPFDVLVNGRWISGIFDRVVRFADRAEVLDFKSGGDQLAATHGPQMAAYRTALAALTGLPEERITARLVGVAKAVVEAV
jgi:ATP-dependent exoDNAse (exonuclease V) beta subunit